MTYAMEQVFADRSARLCERSDGKYHCYVARRIRAGNPARTCSTPTMTPGAAPLRTNLFHQWFGDYVTCESWSNLTVNESFADFSEMLWAEHKYGKDAADAHSYTWRCKITCLRLMPIQKDLVRFHYDDKEDVFDVVTYQKGGRILNMLRNYLGDAAFFKGLNIYLKTNQFKTGEAQQLRLAEEEASGLDLNWFFNEWYYGAGNPVLNISYKWDDAAKTETVYLAQTQDGQTFKLPFCS